MAVTVSNLLSGVGEIYSGAFGATEPVDTAVPAALGVAWTSLGATDGGVKVKVSREYFKLSLDQVTESPGRRMTELEVTLETNLAEVTLANMAVAFADAASAVTSGGTGATAYKAMDIRGTEPGLEPTYLALIFRGRAPKGKVRHVILRKALSQDGDVEQAYAKGEQVFIPVVFAGHYVSPSVTSVHIQDEDSP